MMEECANAGSILSGIFPDEELSEINPSAGLDNNPDSGLAVFPIQDVLQVPGTPDPAFEGALRGIRAVRPGDVLSSKIEGLTKIGTWKEKKAGTKLTE